MSNTKSKPIFYTAFFLMVTLYSTDALCWGPLGHRMATETAALLLERDRPSDWGPFLARHRVELGFYSTLPDSIYRFKDGKNGDLEAPTHFIDLDIAFGSIDDRTTLEKKLATMPMDFKAARKFLETTIGREKALTVGSAPWRVEQFQNLAQFQLKTIKEVKGGYQQGVKSVGDTKNIYDAMYYMGIMSHYSADAAMPYHSSSDWNGWAIGQGGIHFFFEFDCPNIFEPGLSTSVLEEAIRNQKEWISSWQQSALRPAQASTTVTMMLGVAIDSALAIAKLAKIDKENAIIKPSDSITKTPAKRHPAANVCKFFRPLLVERLAKASVITAYLWNSLLPRGVDFKNSATLQFSDFVTDPDYTEPSYLTQKPLDLINPEVRIRR